LADRPKIPRLTERKLYQEAGSRCANCGKTEVEKLRIHHIIPFSENPMHDPEHMILLCLECHDDADRGKFSRKELYAMKKNKSNVIQFPGSKRETPSQITVTGNGNITSGRDTKLILPKAPKMSAPIIPGTVSTDARKIGYLKYLRDRYNDLKNWDCKSNGEKFNPHHLRSSYKREIKYELNDTPLELFEAAVRFLQGRISNTKIGRIRKRQGEILFSSFDNFDQH